MRREGWPLFLLAGILLLPTSALASAKAGGYFNSYHSIYFFIAAAAAARSSRGSRYAVAGVALLALVLAPFTIAQRTSLGGWRRLPGILDNPQEQAVRFTRAHPEQAYFPWHPLSTAWVDGRLYHFDWAAQDRNRAGYYLSWKHASAHVPRRLRYIVVPPDRDVYMLEFFPEFTRRLEIAGMSGWTVYSREPEPMDSREPEPVPDHPEPTAAFVGHPGERSNRVFDVLAADIDLDGDDDLLINWHHLAPLELYRNEG